MWRSPLLPAVLVFFVAGTAGGQEAPAHGLRLPPGYQHKPFPVDPGNRERVGWVEKPGGLKILYRQFPPDFRLPSDVLGDSARFVNMALGTPVRTRLWYRKHTVAGQEVHVTYRRDRMLVVSYPRERMNFFVRVNGPQEMAEAMLLLLSYRPAKKR